jgi:hypothetical protein
MGALGEGTDAAGKFVTALKDLPLWLLIALAIVADVLFFVPGVKGQLPKEFGPWLVIAVVLCNILAISRAVSLVVRAAHGLSVARAARRTFHMSPDERQSFWATARQRDDSTTTQIVVRFTAKNLTDAPLGLVSVRLIRPKIRGEIVHADVMVRAVDSDLYGGVAHSGHRIPAKDILPATTSIIIRGVPKKAPGGTLALALGITDEDGNEQYLKLALKGTAPPKPDDRAVPMERVSSIADSVEKEIVSVLQSELGRYDICGRERGGLGSVHVVYHERALTGVGGDSWSPDSPKNQSIVEDPGAAMLKSDNLEALSVLYSRMTSAQDEGKFVSALLDRLDARKGYLRISYFIVCVLWKVGRLNDGLLKALVDLPEDEIKEFGLSNVLLLLNGLLRYCHPDFTPEALDCIENFIHKLKKEHTFRISDKIAAIRAHRLLSQPAG